VASPAAGGRSIGGEHGADLGAVQVDSCYRSETWLQVLGVPEGRGSFGTWLALGEIGKWMGS